MLLLLGFAFLSGLVTILAPCIWPILPIVFSSSVGGSGHQRPLGITIGVILSFFVLTLALSSLVRIFHFDPNILRILAVIILVFFGLSMLVPKLQQWTEIVISRLASVFGQNRQQQGNGFGAGFVSGLALGVIWSPCAGPILASIAALAATGKVSLDVVLVTTTYVIGIGIPLFFFCYGGQLLFRKARFISQHTIQIQQVFGVVMLLTAVAIFTNYDKIIEVKLLNVFPQFSTSLNNFEGNSAVTKQLDVLQGRTSSTTSLDTSNLFNTNRRAPDFVGITNWLNSDKPLSIKDLRGKVVLVDFWTYTCINCIRTLPHVTAWYDKYKDQGFVVIGVHTPEFAFEKDTGNVQNAIKQFAIHYPVGQDNDYATWNNFNNQYWPAEYLIDASGNVRRTNFGEGDYDKTEMAIQALLKDAGKSVTASLETMPDQTPIGPLSPETYLGSNRMQYYYPNGHLGPMRQTFSLTDKPDQDTFSLGGDWQITNENAVTGNNAALNYHFYADKVFLVLRPGKAGNDAKVKVYLDGRLVDTATAGADVKNGFVTIDSDRLYNLIDLHGNLGDHILRLEFQNPGIEAFAFTFG